MILRKIYFLLFYIRDVFKTFQSISELQNLKKKAVEHSLLVANKVVLFTTKKAGCIVPPCES